MQAISVTGGLVRVDANVFYNLVRKATEQKGEPLIVSSTKGFFKTVYVYLMNYKGLNFWTQSNIPLIFNSSIEIMESERIWFPN